MIPCVSDVLLLSGCINGAITGREGNLGFLDVILHDRLRLDGRIFRATTYHGMEVDYRRRRIVAIRIVIRRTAINTLDKGATCA